MKYLKMTLPALILVVVLIVALVIYPDMAKSYQEKQNAAAAAEQSEEQNAEEQSSEESLSTAESSAEEKSVLINTAPDFEVRDSFGINGRLSDHFGKPIVVNFWATWCPYCVQELPIFDEYAKKYIDEYGYSFPVYYDATGGSTRAYSITGIPVTLFIDRDGNLMTQHVGAIDEGTLLRNIQALEENTE